MLARIYNINISKIAVSAINFRFWSVIDDLLYTFR